MPAVAVPRGQILAEGHGDPHPILRTGRAPFNDRAVSSGSRQAAVRAEAPDLLRVTRPVVLVGLMGAGKTCVGRLLARKLGLDPQTFYDISSKASGQSWSMTSYCPVPGVGPQSPADNEYQGGFAAALMLKDLRLAMEAAESAGAQVPMGKRARELYEAFTEAGQGGLDFSGIIRMLDEKAG